MAIVVAGGDRSFEAAGRWMPPGPSPSLLPEGRTVEAVLLREGAGGGAIRSSDGDAPNGGGGWRRRPSPPVAGRPCQSRVYSQTYRHREIYPGDGPWKGQGSPRLTCYQMGPPASPGRTQPVGYPPGENAGIPPGSRPLPRVQSPRGKTWPGLAVWTFGPSKPRGFLGPILAISPG